MWKLRLALENESVAFGAVQAARGFGVCEVGIRAVARQGGTSPSVSGRAGIQTRGELAPAWVRLHQPGGH